MYEWGKVWMMMGWVGKVAGFDRSGCFLFFGFFLFFFFFLVADGTEKG